jgi:hypothetical protein
MKYTKTLLSAAISALIAFPGNSRAQSPTPTPTPNPIASSYTNKSLSVPQRLLLADGVISSGTDAADVAAAAEFMLTARPVINLLNAYPAFPGQVLADPTLSGTITDATAIGHLYADAVLFQTDATPTLPAKLAYIQPLLSSTLYNATQAAWVGREYGNIAAKESTAQYNAGDYTDSIATALPAVGYSMYPAWNVFRAKVAQRSPDALSWAELIYYMQPYNKSQDGINAVTTAFRALDLNLYRANQFIAYESSGTGTNPLAGTALPSGVVFNNSFSLLGPATPALNLALSGSNTAALNLAVSNFATARQGKFLNAATAFVAQWIRNCDGNIVNANAYMAAQAAGQPYTITELQQ